MSDSLLGVNASAGANLDAGLAAAQQLHRDGLMSDAELRMVLEVHERMKAKGDGDSGDIRTERDHTIQIAVKVPADHKVGTKRCVRVRVEGFDDLVRVPIPSLKCAGEVFTVNVPARAKGYQPPSLGMPQEKCVLECACGAFFQIPDGHDRAACPKCMSVGMRPRPPPLAPDSSSGGGASP